MVRVIEGQVPRGYVLEDVIRVRLVLEGQPDPTWRNTYNELALAGGVPAEAMGYSAKGGDGAGYEHRGVLVVTLPIDVDQTEANGTLDKAVDLLGEANKRQQERGRAAELAESVARNWGASYFNRPVRE